MFVSVILDTKMCTWQRNWRTDCVSGLLCCEIHHRGAAVEHHFSARVCGFLLHLRLSARPDVLRSVAHVSWVFCWVEPYRDSWRRLNVMFVSFRRERRSCRTEAGVRARIQSPVRLDLCADGGSRCQSTDRIHPDGPEGNGAADGRGFGHGFWTGQIFPWPQTSSESLASMKHRTGMYVWITWNQYDVCCDTAALHRYCK